MGYRIPARRPWDPARCFIFKTKILLWFARFRRRRIEKIPPRSFFKRYFERKIKNPLAFLKNLVYTNICCDMIAMKREVAAEGQVFRGANVKLGNWRQVTVLQ